MRMQEGEEVRCAQERMSAPELSRIRETAGCLLQNAPMQEDCTTENARKETSEEICANDRRGDVNDLQRTPVCEKGPV